MALSALPSPPKDTQDCAHTAPVALPFWQPLDAGWWKMHWMQEESRVAVLQSRSWMQWRQQQQQRGEPNSHLNKMPKGSQRK